MAIKSSINHTEALGLTSMNANLKAKADALDAEVEAKRTARRARMAEEAKSI